jgi:hypothetical protein
MLQSLGRLDASVVVLMFWSMDPWCAPPGPFEMYAPPWPFEMYAPPGPFEMCAPPGPFEMYTPPGPFEMYAPPEPFEMGAPPGPFEMGAPPGPFEMWRKQQDGYMCHSCVHVCPCVTHLLSQFRTVPEVGEQHHHQISDRCVHCISQQQGSI